MGDSQRVGTCLPIHSQTNLLDAPMLDSLRRLPDNTWQKLAVLLPAERQVPSRLGRHGRQEDGLVEGGLKAGICWC